MSRQPSLLRTAVEAVFIGLPCLLFFRLWIVVLAEQLKPETKSGT